MNIQELHDRLQAEFPDHVVRAELDAPDPWIEVAAEGLLPVCRWLKASPAYQFNMLNLITAVDYVQSDAKKAAQSPWEPHLLLIYHLSSLIRKTHRLAIKVKLPRWKNDQPGEPPEAPSVSSVWRTADWHEREVYDLCGVWFLGHPDLRRILCPEDWLGFPLRKDYEFPEHYHGIRCR